MKTYPSFLKENFLFITLVLLFLIVGLFYQKPICSTVKKGHYQAEQRAKVITLSLMYPNIPYFSGIVVGIQQPKKEWMEGYFFGRPYIFHSYYQKAVELFPDIDAAHYLLGFCEYYLGNPDKAQEQYEKSMLLQPYFFWAYYDLAVIYFQEGDFLKCARIADESLSLKKEYSLEILKQNPFYQQIWVYIGNSAPIMSNNLNQAREDLLVLLAACFVKQGSFDQALKVINLVPRPNAWHEQLWDALYQKALTHQSTTQGLDVLIKGQIPVRLF